MGLPHALEGVAFCQDHHLGDIGYEMKLTLAHIQVCISGWIRSIYQMYVPTVCVCVHVCVCAKVCVCLYIYFRHMLYAHCTCILHGP